MDPVFEQALQKIPVQLRDRPGVRFTVIVNGTKKPEGKDWAGVNGANYAIGDAPLAGYLVEGHNYGVLCGHDGLTVPDLDDLGALKKLGILARIPDTFRALSGRGGWHVYFDCPELDHQIGLYHPTLKDEDGEPLHLGEIQSKGQQVVGPGSIHPNGNRYELVNDAPIMKISKADLLKIFEGLIITGVDDPAEEPRKAEARRRKSYGSSLGDHIAIDQVAWPNNIKERIGSEVRGSHPMHGSNSGKNFAINTAKNCWHCFRCHSGGGPLEWLAVEAGLISCKEAKPGCLEDKALFKKVLQIAKDKGFNIPESPRGNGQKMVPIDLIFERIKSDPRTLKEADIQAALAALKMDDPIEYDLLLESIRKACKGIKTATINKQIDKYISEMPEAAERSQVPPKEVFEAAKMIIDAGEAYEFIYRTWQTRVKGNEFLGRSLLISRGVQSCLNTKGVHVYAHGKHGHGKSEGMEKMADLIPPEYMMDEDVSPLAIHYASEKDLMLPGTTLLIDEMVWNDSLGGIIKRIITRFQKGAGHLTVIDGETKRVRTKPRIAIWTNSADLQADEQLRDRFLDEAINEGPENLKQIIEFQKKRDTLHDAPEDLEKETMICQEILRDLAAKTFTVKIPYADRIIIQASEGARGYNIFSDLIKGLAAMRYAQREMDEKGQLWATKEDFHDAKAVYVGVKGHSEERYGTSEKRVLQAILDNGHKATIKDLKRLTGLSEGRIKDIINGRGKDEQKRHGLRYKCPQLEVNPVTVSILVCDNQNQPSERRSIQVMEYSLPDNFCMANDEWEIVSLDPDVGDVLPDVEPDVPNINNSKDNDVVDVVRKERGDDTSKLSVPLWMDGSIHSSQAKTQKCYVTTSPYSQIAKKAHVAKNESCVGYVDKDHDSEKHYVDISSGPSMSKIDRPMPGRHTKSERKEVALYVLVDRASYKKDQIVGINVQGEFSVLPEICRLLECGECPTAKKGDPPLCYPCHWQSKPPGRAEA